ncbi:MAG: hypothetical protein FWD56_04485 [Bacteroidales bacterium]|nr:hypothetical protein [Bacteroidales bacterium]
MIESIRNNWIKATLCTIVLLGMLWYPDFAGLNHARLSFLIPCTGDLFTGDLFDSNGYRLIVILMAVINGCALMVMSLRYLSLGRASVLLPLFYLLIVFSSPQARLFSTAFPAALLVVFGLSFLFEPGRAKKPVTQLFISSLMVGCACILFWPSWIVVVSFVVIGVILQRFSGRNILVFTGGLLLTLGGCLFGRYLFYQDLPVFIETINNNTPNLHIQLIPHKPATLFMSLTFFYLFGRAFVRRLFRSFGNQAYRHKVSSSILWMSVICSIPLFLYSNDLFGYLPIFALPASVLLAFYYSEERITKRMKIEFAVLILSIVLNQVAFFIR